MKCEISPSSRLSGLFAAEGYYMRNCLPESKFHDFFEFKKCYIFKNLSIKMINRQGTLVLSIYLRSQT